MKIDNDLILQWEPKFQFKDSLKKVINWYRENG